MSRQRRREMVDHQHPVLSMVRQCALLSISRSSLYYRPMGASPEDLALMKAMDQQYLATPFYGSRRIRVWLSRQGHQMSRKRVQRLMRTMGLTAIYRRPRTSQPTLAVRQGPQRGRAGGLGRSPGTPQRHRRSLRRSQLATVPHTLHDQPAHSGTQKSPTTGGRYGPHHLPATLPR